MGDTSAEDGSGSAATAPLRDEGAIEDTVEFERKIEARSTDLRALDGARACGHGVVQITLVWSHAYVWISL